MTSSTKQLVSKHWDRMSRIKAWLGVIAGKQIKRTADRQERNLQAEEAAVRRQLWGDSDVRDEEMGHTILGDVIGTPQKASSLGTIAALLLGASLPVAGMAGAGAMYLWSTTQDKQADVEQSDETVSLGLGKIEDYLK